MANEQPVGKRPETPAANNPNQAKKPGAPGDPQAAGTGKPAPPPEDDFWRRYSPNHEFPLSSAASVVLHMFAVLMIALFANWVTETQGTTPQIEAIVFAGGGGSPDGNSYDLDAKNMSEAIEFDPTAKPVQDNLPPIENTLTNQNVRPIEKTETKTSDILKRAKGLYGPGSGGGGMSGRGTGIGSGEGPGVETARARRLNRWDMRIEYSSGDEYATYLRQLGAILAFPAGNEKYVLYKDLTQRPARGELVNRDALSKLNRIFWVNNDREAVDLLCSSLGIASGPDRFWAFFPYELEQDLAKKELAYKGRREEDIKETIFKAERRGGKVVVRVESQTGR